MIDSTSLRRSRDTGINPLKMAWASHENVTSGLPMNRFHKRGGETLVEGNEQRRSQERGLIGSALQKP